MPTMPWRLAPDCTRNTPRPITAAAAPVQGTDDVARVAVHRGNQDVRQRRHHEFARAFLLAGSITVRKRQQCVGIVQRANETLVTGNRPEVSGSPHWTISATVPVGLRPPKRNENRRGHNSADGSGEIEANQWSQSRPSNCLIRSVRD